MQVILKLLHQSLLTGKRCNSSTQQQNVATMFLAKGLQSSCLKKSPWLKMKAKNQAKPRIHLLNQVRLKILLSLWKSIKMLQSQSLTSKCLQSQRENKFQHPSKLMTLNWSSILLILLCTSGPPSMTYSQRSRRQMTTTRPWTFWSRSTKPAQSKSKIASLSKSAGAADLRNQTRSRWPCSSRSRARFRNYSKKENRCQNRTKSKLQQQSCAQSTPSEN